MPRTSILLLLLLSVVCGFSQQNDCVLKIKADDIMVYTCKSEKQKFKSLKAEFTIKNTTPDQLMIFLKNVSNFPTWQYKMTSAEVLLKETEDAMIARSVIDAPWPVSNRELIVEYSFEKTASLDHLHIVVKTVEYDYPLTEELVRIPFSHAEWFVDRDGTALKVTYSLHIDPGGNVPAWLVNIAMAEGPYHSFLNLKKQLE